MGSALRDHFGHLAFAAALALVSACAGRVSVPSIDAGDIVGYESEAEGKADPSPVSARGRESAGSLEITVDEAVLLALENNRAFSIDRLRPSIKGTAVDEARAAFDVTVSADASALKDRGGPYTTTIEGVSTGLSRRFAGGTTVGVEVSAGRRDTFGLPDVNDARLGVELRQPVLRNAGREAGLATLRQTMLDVRLSEHELKGLAEALVAEVEKAYWDYVLAGHEIDIFDESLKLSEKQLEETRERIRVGRLAETEAAAAQAELALRREARINARVDLEKARLRLLRLTGQAGRLGFTSRGAQRWDRPLVARSSPVVPRAALPPPEEMVMRALAARPDLRQARLEVLRDELEVVKTKNGLLPRLDLFVTLGKSGYSDTIGGAAADVSGVGYDARVGVAFEYVLGGRASRARQRRAVLSREQAEMAVENLEQLAEFEVRRALIEAERTREQIAATRATREFREEALRAESEKFRVGRSTTLLVAQAQRDLVASRVSEVRALVNHLKALVDLYRAEGTLIERRGISMGIGSGAGRALPNP